MIYFIGPPELQFGDYTYSNNINVLVNWLKDKTVIAVDTETEGFFDFNNKVIMLQIGNQEDQFVIDTRHVDVQALKPFIESSTLTKVFWNAKFDINFIRHTFGFVTDNVFDCFLAECLLTAGKEDAQLSLGYASVKYLHKTLDKSVRNKFTSLAGRPYTHNQIKYGAEDVEGLIAIMDIQKEELKQERLLRVMNLENCTVSALADIEWNGMLLDTNKWLSVATKTEQNADEYVRILDDYVLNDPRLSRFIPPGIQTNLFGYEERRIKINWSSPAQKVEVIQALGIDLDTSNSMELIKYRKEPLIGALLEYSKQTKLADSFGRDFIKFINPVTGRIHQSIWQVLK